jgi:hypothetical protein
MAHPYRRRIVSFASRAYSRDPLERVDCIGGTNPDFSHWKLSQAAAIALIEAGTDEFLVRVDGRMLKLVVLTTGGEKYLQTEREKKHPDDLLNLLGTGPKSA